MGSGEKTASGAGGVKPLRMFPMRRGKKRSKW